VDPGRPSGAQGRPEAEVTTPSIALSGPAPPAQKNDSGGASADRSSRTSNNSTDQPTDGLHRLSGSGSSSPAAAEPKKATKDIQSELGVRADQPQLARTEPHDRRLATPEVPKSATPGSAGAQCNVDVCSATYASFHATDCTYQPRGGGPRRICELSTQSTAAPPQTSRGATDPRSEAKETRVAERAVETSKLTTPARPGGQCNVSLCSATYASFHAADCTYQPHGGGPRRICER
jgi:hypothetical protein